METLTLFFILSGTGALLAAFSAKEPDAEQVRKQLERIYQK